MPSSLWGGPDGGRTRREVSGAPACPQPLSSASRGCTWVRGVVGVEPVCADVTTGCHGQDKAGGQAQGDGVRGLLARDALAQRPHVAGEGGIPRMVLAVTGSLHRLPTRTPAGSWEQSVGSNCSAAAAGFVALGCRCGRCPVGLGVHEEGRKGAGRGGRAATSAVGGERSSPVRSARHRRWCARCLGQGREVRRPQREAGAAVRAGLGVPAPCAAPHRAARAPGTHGDPAPPRSRPALCLAERPRAPAGRPAAWT